MNNEQYTGFETAFTGPATKLLEQLRAALVGRGYGPFTEIEKTDHDVDRGLEFRSIDDPSVYVELRLTDGESYGFDGVGLIMECSTYICGQVWAPGNFTEDVGITSNEDLVSRLGECPIGEIAWMVTVEWDRIANKDLLEENHAPR